MIQSASRPYILVTGATGYVGGRLIDALLERQYKIRCVVRNKDSIPSLEQVGAETVIADLDDLDQAVQALAGVDIAYYLVHSLGSGKGFEDKEIRCATNFALAARINGIKRVVYLGGLGSGDALSMHLRTRQKVGRILQHSGAQTIEFRASIIIGSGSLSFEMVRALVDKLPIMITPRWVRSRAQPIAIEDVVQYLLAAIDVQLAEQNKVFEIGGPDVVSYQDIMLEYARQIGVSRWVVPVPLLTPRLSSLWLGLVTPLYARIGRKLIDGLRNDTLVENNDAERLFSIPCRGLAAAIERALCNEDNEFALTRWSDSLSASGEVAGLRSGSAFRPRIIDKRKIAVACSPSQAFYPIATIGGANGWYYCDWAWRARGFIDLLAGGVGARRGRSNPETPEPGDTIDFWRVEAYEPSRLLRLRAEMKLPGRAWLQFEITEKDGGSEIHQIAIFDPLGLGGLLYWYLLLPVHKLIFAGMLNAIGSQALKRCNGEKRGNHVEV